MDLGDLTENREQDLTGEVCLVKQEVFFNGERTKGKVVTGAGKASLLFSGLIPILL